MRRNLALFEHRDHHEAKPGSERSFGLVLSVAFTIIGTVPLVRGGELRIWSLLLAAAFLGPALVAPRILRPLNIIWFRFGMLLGRLIAPVVSSLLYFFAVTPTALMMRMMRKDILSLKFDRNAESYWVKRTKTENPMGSMKNQF